MVLCPKRAIDTWHREFKKHLGRDPDDTVLIINYEQVRTQKGFKKIEEFAEYGSKLYVNIDEIHNLAGVSSQRFLLLDVLLTNRGIHITGTTGTFIRNKTTSFYAPYRLLTGADLTYKLFADTFYDDIRRQPKNLPQLARLYSRIGLRRTLKDVDIDLPRMNIEKISIKMLAEQKKVYNGVLS